jgi:hypothetical protein
MELWPLGLAVVVLVLAAFWVVTRDADGESGRSEEVLPMRVDLNQPNVAAQEAAQSAQTAGQQGVEAAQAGVEQAAAAARDTASAVEAITAGPSTAEETLRAYSPGGYSDERGLMPISARTGMGAAGALTAAGGIAAAAIVFMRWQRERNRPVNRFRRQARGLLEDFGSQMRDRPGVAPAGGAASIVALSSVLVARALIGRRAAPLEEALALAPGPMGRMQAAAALLEPVVAAGLNTARANLLKAPEASRHQLEAARRGPPMPMRAGLGAVAVLGAAGYLAWRVIKREPAQPQSWQIETSRQ